MFHSDLDLRQKGMWEKRAVFQLLPPTSLRFSVWGLIEGECPVYFYTDLASVPRHLGAYERFGGRCNKESVPHDYLYRRGSILRVNPKAMIPQGLPSEIVDWITSSNQEYRTEIPQFIADHVFRQLMVEEKEEEELVLFMYEAVYMGGSMSFHKFAVMDPLPMDKIDIVKD